ncbi:MAG TPA: aminopeptidase P N-terminal domain-containing protein [Acidimicrobiales bacterium]|nr:aminopeptidase P N-terminal domain-containing protein [Acidimicrobiales bacterium]
MTTTQPTATQPTATDWADLGFEPLPDLFQANFTRDELAARRLAVLDRIGPDDLVLLQGAPAPSASEPFRQSNDFYYLCGVEVPHAYLLLNGRTRTTSLYLPHRDASHEASEGPRLSPEDADEAASLTGVEAVRGIELLAEDLQRLVLRRGTTRCYTPLSPAEQARSMRDQLLRARASAASDPWEDSSTREARFARRVSERFPQLQIADLSPLLDRMRLVKSPAELGLLRVAGRLSAIAATEAMRCTRPGMMEFELAAIAGLCFTAGGARSEGYRAIVAGGANAWFPHYGRLGSPLQRGDLVLMNYAPDVAYYTSDIGRMWPVSGRYSPLQRLVYGFVVEYHRELLRLIRPGALPADVLDEAAATMRERIEELRFPDSAYKQGAQAMLGFSGHLSHPVGMAVHDVGDYADEPFVPGTVLALDPQMWVHSERTYIRCEDTVAITDDGVEVLTASAPLDVEQIEQAMAEPSQLTPVLGARSWWGLAR